jgi:hypothetical protein
MELPKITDLLGTGQDSTCPFAIINDFSAVFG